MIFIARSVCLSKRTHLHSVSNKLHSLLQSIGNLLHLQVLDLSNNRIDKIPQTIGKLGKIRKLNLDCSLLKTSPDEVIDMRCEELSLNENKLISPATLKDQMKSLNNLLLNDNLLESIPTNICSSSTLQVLHLCKNNWTGLPKSIGNIVSLEYGKTQ